MSKRLYPYRLTVGAIRCCTIVGTCWSAKVFAGIAVVFKYPFRILTALATKFIIFKDLSKILNALRISPSLHHLKYSSRIFIAPATKFIIFKDPSKIPDVFKDLSKSS